MIDAKKAKELFTPLRGMPAEPTDPAVIRTRYEALAAHARSEGHARRVVALLAATLSYFPTVAEITQICETTPDDAEAIGRRESCVCCGGTGYVIVRREDGAEGARKCQHR